MSLFGIGNDLNRQFIARPDAAKQFILFKWPDMTIRRLTQVTVQPDETAIFVKEGKIVGKLPQGRSTLDGALIPFLGDLVDLASGGNMYRAELYFIGTREFVNLPFGGPIDDIEDPETGLAVGLRVFGEYAIIVSDPATLILNLVGTRQTSNDGITDWAREQILKSLRTGVVRKLTAEKWPVLGIAGRTAEIETALLGDVQASLVPYGLTVTRLGNVTISLKPEDEHTLKELRKDKAYTRLAGGFREYGVGAALKGFGEGSAAGGGNGTAALGVGMGLGGIVAGLGSVAPAQAPPAPGAAPGSGGSGPASGGSPPAAASIDCAKCHAQNAPGAKFCSSCGTALAPPRTGALHAMRNRHCAECAILRQLWCGFDVSSGMIGSSCRAGGGGHAGSHSASGFGSSGHVVGGGGGGYGGPGIIGVMVILFILWLYSAGSGATFRVARPLPLRPWRARP